ncbi:MULTISPECIES: FadR/GntR family transcriptional regulator [Halomonadaceae]|uniref:FadR/GntR family transcriptional regulator n=1 Tax=Halomonadaceae TaxID=28256 RepID=UPI00159722D7|nr:MULTISPECIES: FCD domain-containing protein [Halomonas]QJQ95020.1 FadR family transcriptional regulator [Halomonas sp. PA5]
MHIDLEPYQEREGLRAPALHNSTVDSLGLRIIRGELRPGDVLTLEGIGASLGVSRTVAREAMRLLESLGLVISRRRVGIIVQPAEAWQVFDPRVIWWRLSSAGRDDQLRSLTELRIAVEPLAAASAARMAGASERRQLVEIADTMRALGEAGELQRFLEQDIAFHSLLLATSGNEMFAALTHVVTIVLKGRTELGMMPAHPVPEALDLHDAVAQAVANGDPVQAELAMRSLLTEVRSAMVQEAP